MKMSGDEKVEFFAATDVGRRRKHNEDNYLVDPDLGLFVVADGMGGHAAGEVASALAVHTIHELVIEHYDVVTAGSERDKAVLNLLEYAVQEASARIHAEATRDPSRRGMGTTLSAVLLVGGVGYVVHVGDSRVYLARGQQLHCLTEDHTVANELIRLGRLSPEEAKNLPRKNAITRAVGVYQRAEVDSLRFETAGGDRLLLASDGLTGYVDEQEYDLAKVLRQPDGEAAVDELIAFANAQGGKDNITAVLVAIGSESDSKRATKIQHKQRLLGDIRLFGLLTPREKLLAMQTLKHIAYSPRATVIKEGDQGDEMFILVTGKLSVLQGGTQVSVVQPGEHFGEMSLIQNSPRTATVVCELASELLVLHRDDFFGLLRDEPELGVKLLWQFLGVLSERLDNTNRALSVLRNEVEDAKVDTPRRHPVNPFKAGRRRTQAPFSSRSETLADDVKGTLTLDSPNSSTLTGGARAISSQRRAKTIDTSDMKATIPEETPPVQRVAANHRRTAVHASMSRRGLAKTREDKVPSAETSPEPPSVSSPPPPRATTPSGEFKPSRATVPLVPKELRDELKKVRDDFKRELEEKRSGKSRDPQKP